MLWEHREEYDSEWAAMESIAVGVRLGSLHPAQAVCGIANLRCPSAQETLGEGGGRRVLTKRARTPRAARPVASTSGRLCRDRRFLSRS